MTDSILKNIIALCEPGPERDRLFDGVLAMGTRIAELEAKVAYSEGKREIDGWFHHINSTCYTGSKGTCEFCNAFFVKHPSFHPDND